MKKLSKLALTGLFFLVATLNGLAQFGVQNPVTWDWEVKELGGGKYELVFTPTIEDHYHIYSLTTDNGPLPTEFIFESNSAIEWLTPMQEDEPIVEYDSGFDADLAYHDDGVKFTRKLKVNAATTTLEGYVTWMACNDEGCLPPDDVEFSFDLKGQAPQTTTSTDEPEEVVEGTNDTGDEGSTDEAQVAEADDSDSTEVEEAVVVEGEEDNSSMPAEKDGMKSLWTIFFLAMGGGLVALVTPCVFPMIPMTVSFFTKQSKTPREGVGKALIYGFSIVGIYVLISLPFHIFSQLSPDVFNQFSTNATLNVILFVVFIIFALSFLGAFEITLPSSWINSADRRADKGGLVGIFFMAIVLILVSFTCTGPALAGVLGGVLSQDGGATALTVAFLGFGLGLAFPFTLFAIFPGWMNSLPKSGGWMNVVKVSLGYLELAFAFKFLSQADLVQQWGILHRELFIAIWIAVFAAWTMYMFNLYRLPHDSDVNRISVGRSVVGTIIFAFTLYLIPGLFGAPLKLIAGMPPPSFYSEVQDGLYGRNVVVSGGGDHAGIPDGAHPETCPHGLNCFHDYEVGLAYAKEVNKPILLDFTGWACVNCRRMEENVWSDPSILESLRNDFVLISLYVDERTELPEDEQYVSEITGKKIRNVGNYWTDFEIKHYEYNGQPFYVIVGHDDLEPLVPPRAYDTDIQAYKDWMEAGIKKFNAQ